MNPLISAALNYIVNSIWQIPIIFLAATLAARFAHPVGPRTQHKIWVAALFAKLILPLCQFDAPALWQQLSTLSSNLFDWNTHAVSVHGQVEIQLGPITALPPAWLHLPKAAQNPLLVIYLAICLYFALRLTLGIRNTHKLALNSRPIADSRNIHTLVPISISQTITSPVTIGFWHPILLLPAGFLKRVAPADLDAVLAHEQAHIDRHDFAKNLLYGLISIPIAYHGILWLTCKRIAETREMICDEIAAASLANQSLASSSLNSRESYARSLLQLASLLAIPAQPTPLHAIGIFDANIPGIFERRIMNLTRKSSPISRSRKLAFALGCSMLAVITCAATLTIHLNAATPIAQPVAQVNQSKPLSRDIKDLKLVKKVNPTYPAEAKTKKDTIDGTVTLEAIIGKDGAVENLKVKKSLRSDYDKSALDAVKDWRYEPYQLNGEPIEVETTIDVTFALAK